MIVGIKIKSGSCDRTTLPTGV